MKSSLSSQLLTAFAGILLVMSSCRNTNVSDPDTTPVKIEPVPADGILETVTWNIEWYGNAGNNRGPDDEQQQTSNVIKVVDSLKADLYALQEISTQDDLNMLTDRMSGYRGFTADHIDYKQRTAFIYNTQTIDSVSSGSVDEFQDENDWAGRLPLFFKFNYQRNESDSAPLEVYAVVIHAKASVDPESYRKRKRAAKSLYKYLSRMKPDAHIVFLGDYNDDVDVSIYDENETPYLPFLEDPDEFLVITKSLSDEGLSSTVNYPDMVDHITVSNEMKAFYVPGSESRFVPENNFISNYGESTSDHYPVMARFDLSR